MVFREAENHAESRNLLFAAPPRLRRGDLHVPCRPSKKQTRTHHWRRHRPRQRHGATLPRTGSRSSYLRPPRRSSPTNCRRAFFQRTDPPHTLRRPQPRRRRSDDRFHLERRPTRHPGEQCGGKFHRPHRRTFSRRMELRDRHRANGHAELHHGLRTPLARRKTSGHGPQHLGHLCAGRLGLCRPFRRRPKLESKPSLAASPSNGATAASA